MKHHPPNASYATSPTFKIGKHSNLTRYWEDGKELWRWWLTDGDVNDSDILGVYWSWKEARESIMVMRSGINPTTRLVASNLFKVEVWLAEELAEST